MIKLQNTVQRYIRKLFKRDRARIINLYPYRNILSQKELQEIAKRSKIPIERYTKSELARMYKRTVQTFMKWVRDNKLLMQELKRTGYKSSLKEFTKEQVLLIFAYLGEP